MARGRKDLCPPDDQIDMQEPRASSDVPRLSIATARQMKLLWIAVVQVLQTMGK